MWCREGSDRFIKDQPLVVYMLTNPENFVQINSRYLKKKNGKKGNKKENSWKGGGGGGGKEKVLYIKQIFIKEGK